ncbi:MAG: FAD-dependent oxidoreductase [Cyclobacteriaceae bacterium]|nr:FAD-dependent oxidoreductase [Cyclobacteriaceae bacterium]
MNVKLARTGKEKVAIIGAGMSGLSCAHLMHKESMDFQLFEAAPHIGGLARSFPWHGIDCDLAPHRLFSKDQEVLKELLELTPMIAQKRQSKIFIKGKVIKDPVNPFELVLKFNPIITSKLVFGYIFKKKRPETSFENLALNAFGRGLYDFFFRPYTVKLLGATPEEISMEWGRQKIRVSGLSDVFKRNSKIFFRGFYYPKRGGYGAIVNALHAPVQDRTHLNARVIGLVKEEGKITGVRYVQNGEEKVYECDRVISTIPTTILGKMLGYDLKFRFQPVKLVFMMVNKDRVAPYHWIYFGDEKVVINRLAEFKNFSDEGAAKDKTVLCAEVTTHTEDPVSDVLKAVYDYKLFKPEELGDVLLLEEKFGYPVYLKDFEKEKEKVQNMLKKYENLHLVGRNAEFRHIDVDEDYESARNLVKQLKDDLKEKIIPISDANDGKSSTNEGKSAAAQ